MKNDLDRFTVVGAHGHHGSGQDQRWFAPGIVSCPGEARAVGARRFVMLFAVAVFVAMIAVTDRAHAEPEVAAEQVPDETFSYAAGFDEPVYVNSRDEYLRILERERQRRRWGKSRLVSAVVLRGIYWLENVHENDVDRTLFNGMGIHFDWGLIEQLAVEGQFILGETGDARFEDHTARDGRFARLDIGAILRWPGRRWRPNMTTGTGFQRFRYSDGNEVAWGWHNYLGVGLDLLITDNLVIAATATVSYLPAEELSFVDTGIRVGYTWMPDR